MHRQTAFATALAALLSTGTPATPLFAEDTVARTADAAVLATTLQLEALFAAIAEEGAQGGRDLDASLLGARGGQGWADAVARAYDPAALRPAFETALIAALADRPGAEEAALAFFGAEPGRRILALEVAARRALLDVPSREAAEVQAERMGERRDPRLRLIRRLIEAGDMIEQGTTATLAAYLAFNEGLATTAPAGLAGRPEDRSAEVYAQEAQVRADTATWLISFMTLAYAPLTEAELEAYVAFAESDGGKAYNAAVALAFEATMIPVSRALGTAAGLSLAGLDI